MRVSSDIFRYFLRPLITINTYREMSSANINSSRIERLFASCRHRLRMFTKHKCVVSILIRSGAECMAWHCITVITVQAIAVQIARIINSYILFLASILIFCVVPIILVYWFTKYRFLFSGGPHENSPMYVCEYDCIVTNCTLALHTIFDVNFLYDTVILSFFLI